MLSRCTPPALVLPCTLLQHALPDSKDLERGTLNPTCWIIAVQCDMLGDPYLDFCSIGGTRAALAVWDLHILMQQPEPDMEQVCYTRLRSPGLHCRETTALTSVQHVSRGAVVP